MVAKPKPIYQELWSGIAGYRFNPDYGTVNNSPWWLISGVSTIGRMSAGISLANGSAQLTTPTLLLRLT